MEETVMAFTKKRYKLGRKSSRKSFRGNAGKSKVNRVRIMRGGYRL